MSRRFPADAASAAADVARGQLLVLLLGLGIGLALVHLGSAAAGAWAWAGGAGTSAGSADTALLGLLAPAQLALGGGLAALAAREGRDRGLAWAAAVAIVLALADAASLPTRLAPLLASHLDGLGLPGLSPVKTGKLLIGGGLAASLVGVLLATGWTTEARRLGRVLMGFIIGSASTALLLDVPAGLGPIGLGGSASLLLDAVEETVEAALASRVLAFVLTANGAGRHWSLNRTTLSGKVVEEPV